jgi:Tol biopolymer transport system component
MRANGSNVRQLTSDHASYIGGFSPDGRFLTFTRDVGDTNDVFRSASTGAARRT